MPIHFINYDDEGRIFSYAFRTDPNDTPVGPERNIVYVTERPDPQLKYVAEGAVVDRPANPATLNGLVLSGVPVPSTLSINGTPYAITEDTVNLTFPNIGTYKLLLVCWPYLDTSWEINV